MSTASKDSNFKLMRQKAFLSDLVADALSRPSKDNAQINTLTATKHMIVHLKT